MLHKSAFKRRGLFFIVILALLIFAFIGTVILKYWMPWSWSVAVSTSVAVALLPVLMTLLPSLNTWWSQLYKSRNKAKLSGELGLIKNCELLDLGVHPSDRNDEEFIMRDKFSTVKSFLVIGEPVLIEGSSMSGKTRLAVEVLRKNFSEHLLWRPSRPEDVTQMMEDGTELKSETIIFLDDIDKFLTSGVSLAHIDRKSVV